MRPRIAIPVPNSTRIDYVLRALPQCERAVRAAGGEPVVIDVKGTNAEIAQAVKLCDGVLLPGSPADVDPEKYGALRHPKTAPADPLRDNADELLLQDAYNMRKPVLAICYGLQSLNVWRTGTLDQELPTGVKHEAGKTVSARGSAPVTLLTWPGAKATMVFRPAGHLTDQARRGAVVGTADVSVGTQHVTVPVRLEQDVPQPTVLQRLF